MAHALLQGKAEVTLRMHLAVFAEHTCHQGLAAISAQQATAVGDVVRAIPGMRWPRCVR